MEQEKLMNLPILRHYEGSELAVTANKLKKGEVPIYNILKLAFYGVLAWATWVYVLPPVFLMLGKLIAIVATIVAIVFLVMATPAILSFLRLSAKKLHKAVIKQDPFGELDRQKSLMIANQQKLRTSKARIDGLQQEMVIEADASEKKAKSLRDKIVRLRNKAAESKALMTDLVNKGGEAIKKDDKYINAQIEFMKAVADGERNRHSLLQEEDFVKKYGARGVIMKKLSQKLAIIEVSVDIKVKDFDATIDILKKDFEFAKKSKEATNAAKDAMLFSKSWELEYALDVVTSTIANDIAITSGNIKDIDSITTNYAIDSDEMWSNLELISNNIVAGNEPIALASDYNNPDYQLTTEDRKATGGFGNIF